MSNTIEPLLRFSGPPRHLSALMAPDFPADREAVRWEARLVSDEAAAALDVPITIECVKHLHPGVRKVATRLPPSTPPGRYVVAIDVEGTTREAVLEVQPRARSQIFPKRVRLTVCPGETAEVDLEICNVGNVTLAIPQMTAFVIANSEALCRAIQTTVMTHRKGEERPLDRLANEMMDNGYGGTVHVRTHCKELAIAPGEVTALSASLRMPNADDMLTERTYWGLWNVHSGKSHRVILDVV